MTTNTQTSLPITELNDIVGMLRAANPEPATNEIWDDAAATGTFSLSAGGGNLEGWLSLYDGRKYYFKLETITSRSGTAAGTFAVPLVRVRPLKDVEVGDFDLSGFLAVGSLKLDAVKDAIPVISVAPWDYHLAGTVKYTKA